MLTLAHIVNPVTVSERSDLFVAQPVTFETMRRAREAARPEVEVALLTAQEAGRSAAARIEPVWSPLHGGPVDRGSHCTSLQG